MKLLDTGNGGLKNQLEIYFMQVVDFLKILHFVYFEIKQFCDHISNSVAAIDVLKVARYLNNQLQKSRRR